MQTKEFSTFDVGRICNVAHTTVINWIERKELVAHSTPGGHRRVYYNDLLTFLKQYNMRIPPELLETEKKPSILIVDDEAEVLVMLSRAFREHAPQFNVHTTQNGMEALMIVGREPPAVIILDVVMPNMDGLTALKEMRAVGDDFGAIIFTGYGDESSAIQAMREGAFNFIKKPIDLEQLIVSVEKAIEKVKTERSLRYRIRDLELAEQIIARITRTKEIIIEFGNPENRSAWRNACGRG